MTGRAPGPQIEPVHQTQHMGKEGSYGFWIGMDISAEAVGPQQPECLDVKISEQSAKSTIAVQITQDGREVVTVVQQYIAQGIPRTVRVKPRKGAIEPAVPGPPL